MLPPLCITVALLQLFIIYLYYISFIIFFFPLLNVIVTSTVQDMLHNMWGNIFLKLYKLYL